MQPTIKVKREDIKYMELIEEILPFFSFHFACPKCKHCINVEFSSVEIKKELK